MSTQRPLVRPAGRRHYRDQNDYDFEGEMKRRRRVTEDLQNMTHNMEFENIGERPTSDVIKGGKNSP